MRRLRVAILVVLAVSLAGCSGFLGQSGPSLSEPHAEVIEGEPALVFNYSVDDYATVLLQNPDGNVVQEATVEPNKSVDGFYMGAPTAGTYKLVLQNGGETVTEKEVTFDGADPSITDVETNWSANTLKRVNLTVRNRGDLPARVSDPVVEVYGTTVELRSTTWIAPNESRTISVTPSYQALEVTQPGDARGTVTARTQSGNLSATFQQTFEAPQLTVQDVQVDWEGTALQSATVSVTNDGDLPTEGNALITHADSELATSYDKTIPAGGDATFELAGMPIYEHESAGTVDLTVVVNTSDGFAEETISHTAEPADLTLQSFSPVWEGPQLQAVAFTVANTGDMGSEFTASLSVRGSDVVERTRTVAGDSNKTFTFEPALFGSESLYSVQSGGEVAVTLSVKSDSGTGSKTKTQQFDGVEAEFSSVDPMFIGQVLSDNVDLSSISFAVRNTGDVQLEYDAVRLSMDGSSKTFRPYSSTVINPGGSETESQFLDEDLTVTPGTHELTIELRSDGTTVSNTTTSVTAGG